MQKNATRAFAFFACLNMVIGAGVIAFGVYISSPYQSRQQYEFSWYSSLIILIGALEVVTVMITFIAAVFAARGTFNFSFIFMLLDAIFLLLVGLSLLIPGFQSGIVNWGPNSQDQAHVAEIFSRFAAQDSSNTQLSRPTGWVAIFGCFFPLFVYLFFSRIFRNVVLKEKKEEGDARARNRSPKADVVPTRSDRSTPDFSHSPAYFENINSARSLGRNWRKWSPPGSKQGLAGVGIVFEPDINGDMRVARLVDGGPAMLNGGVYVGDIIVGVNGRQAAKKRHNELAKLLLGPPGTMVRIDFRSPDSRVSSVMLRRGVALSGRANARYQNYDMNQNGTGFYSQRGRKQPEESNARHQPTSTIAGSTMPPDPNLVPHVDVGLEVAQDDAGDLRVVSTNPGTPAALSGVISPGDQLVEVDGISMSGRSSEEAQQLLIGPVGQVVRCILVKWADNSRIEVDLLRSVQPAPQMPVSDPVDGAAMLQQTPPRKSRTPPKTRFGPVLHSEPAGIGAGIAPRADGSLTIRTLQPGGPASNAGLQVGDTVHSVNGVVVTGMEISDVVPMIMGAPGSAVQMGICKKGSSDVIFLNITRVAGVANHEFFDWTGKFGVGLFLQSDGDGGNVVSSLLRGSPAEKCGTIKVGDQIRAVNNVNVHGMNLRDIAPLLLGPHGSAVNLTFRRTKSGVSRFFDVTLYRGSQSPSSQRASAAHLSPGTSSPIREFYAGREWSPSPSRHLLSADVLFAHQRDISATKLLRQRQEASAQVAAATAEAAAAAAASIRYGSSRNIAPPQTHWIATQPSKSSSSGSTPPKQEEQYFSAYTPGGARPSLLNFTPAQSRQISSASLGKVVNDDSKSDSGNTVPYIDAEDMRRSVGLMLSQESSHDGIHTYVSAMIPGSAAITSGRVDVGDEVLSVDGQSCLNYSVERIAGLLAGKEGTFVVLQLRKLNGDIFTVSLCRTIVEIENVNV